VVQRALARSSGTLATAARLLGISRPTLYALLDAHGLSADAGLAAAVARPAGEDTAP
jgi:two-component system NtrC family response regulator